MVGIFWIFRKGGILEKEGGKGWCMTALTNYVDTLSNIFLKIFHLKQEQDTEVTNCYIFISLVF